MNRYRASRVLGFLCTAAQAEDIMPAVTPKMAMGVDACCSHCCDKTERNNLKRPVFAHPLRDVRPEVHVTIALGDRMWERTVGINVIGDCPPHTSQEGAQDMIRFKATTFGDLLPSDRPHLLPLPSDYSSIRK